jgi:hypothetical protein
MNYTTIKIPAETHKIIKNLAVRANLAQQELLYKCLMDFEKKLFWEQCQRAYSKTALSEDSSISDDSLLYENTLMDGLDDEY